MRIKQKSNSVTLRFPVIIDFADLGANKEDAKVTDYQSRKKRTRQSRTHYTLS